MDLSIAKDASQWNGSRCNSGGVAADDRLRQHTRLSNLGYRTDVAPRSCRKTMTRSSEIASIICGHADRPDTGRLLWVYKLDPSND